MAGGAAEVAVEEEGECCCEAAESAPPALLCRVPAAGGATWRERKEGRQEVTPAEQRCVYMRVSVCACVCEAEGGKEDERKVARFDPRYSSRQPLTYLIEDLWLI